jgi:hypothetical protein
MEKVKWESEVIPKNQDEFLYDLGKIVKNPLEALERAVVHESKSWRKENEYDRYSEEITIYMIRS